jgi:hypothetical protein
VLVVSLIQTPWGHFILRYIASVGQSVISHDPVRRLFAFFKGMALADLTPWIGPALFIGGGVLTTLASLPALRLALATRHWPLVPGRIVVSRPVTRSVSSSDGRDEIQQASITYVYDVAGRRHQGCNVIAAGWGRPGRSAVLRYPKGAACSVAHDPAQPRRAVLEPGVHGIHCVFPAMGLVFVLLGIAMGAA